MFSSFFHIVARVKLSFIFKAESYSIVWPYHLLLIRLSADGPLGCLYISAPVNSAAMKVHE